MARNLFRSTARWVFRILGTAVLLIVVVTAVQSFRLLDFGAKPDFIVDQAALAQDVQFIEANGLRFGYLESGEGPLVLLLHGYPETARSWHEVQADLADSGFRTVAVFMRGYAPTSAASDYSVRSLGQDVVSLIEAFGENEAIVVGHDWGASAAYEAAFTAPEKVSHLVALSIPHPKGTQPSLGLFLVAPHFLYYQLPTAERLVWSNDFDHIRTIFKTWSPGFDMPEGEFNNIRNTLQTPDGIAGPMAYYHAVAANGAGNADIQPTSEITVPTLVIAGDSDGTVNLDGFSNAEPAFTGPYSFEVLDGVGHFPQVEQPRKVAAAIRDFVLRNQ